MDISTSQENNREELVNRYKAQYGIPQSIELTEEHVRQHWNEACKLRTEILNSCKEDRPKVTKKAYDRLFRLLSAFPGRNENGQNVVRAKDFAFLLEIIGPPPANIYEVGSGEGQLALFLATQGYTVRGSDISAERGQHCVPDKTPNLTWGQTDGVYLSKYEPKCVYDIGLSIDVVEHLHPEDLPVHLNEMFTLLRPGGKYVFVTPHRYAGPSDITRVFGLDEPMGGHLREYTWREIISLLKHAGFSKIYGLFPPWIWRRRLDQINSKLARYHIRVPILVKLSLRIGLKEGQTFLSAFFPQFMVALELFLALFPQRIRRYLYLRRMRLDRSMVIVAQRPLSH